MTSDARRRPYAIYGERRKPLLIWIGGPLILLQAFGAFLFLLLIIYDALADPSARTSQSLLAFPGGVIMAGAIAALGYGLYREKLWARPLVTAWLVILIIAAAYEYSSGRAGEVFLIASIATIIPTSLVFWYFYGKRTVRVYYESLATDRMQSSVSP